MREPGPPGRSGCRRQPGTDAMGSIQEAQEANKHTQTKQVWMLNHTLQRCRHGQIIPNVGDIKEKYVPYIRRLREAQNPWNQEALLEEMPDLATPARVPPGSGGTSQQNKGSYGCLGGSGRSTPAAKSPRARTSNSSSRRRSSWPWSAGPTHSRVSGTTSTRSSTWRSERR